MTAVNLALTFAKAYSQTALLVDADLKRQQVHQVLGFESDKGLGDYLQDGCDVSDLIVWPGIEKLTVISGGKRIEESSELLGSPGMKALVRGDEEPLPGPVRLLRRPPGPGRRGRDLLRPPGGPHPVRRPGGAGRRWRTCSKALGMLPKEKILGIVLNRQADADARKYYYY